MERLVDLYRDWQSWMAYFKTYEVATSQLIRLQEVVSCDNRNQRLKRSAAAKRGNRVNFVPAEWQVYQRTYICTHGWQSRHCGDAKRPRRHMLSTGCQFRFVIQMANVSGEWQLKVKNGIIVHSHPVDPVSISAYPASRGIKDPENKARVDMRLQSGAAQARIYNYLLEQGENVVWRDVDNLVDLHQSRSHRR